MVAWALRRSGALTIWPVSNPTYMLTLQDQGRKKELEYANIQPVLHFSQAVPCTNRLKSSMVEVPCRAMVIVFLGKHKPALFHGGTQNSFSASELTTQPDERS